MIASTILMKRPVILCPVMVVETICESENELKCLYAYVLQAYKVCNLLY